MYNLSNKTYIDGIDNTDKIETLVWSDCGNRCTIKFRGTHKAYTFRSARVSHFIPKSQTEKILDYLRGVADILHENSTKNKQELEDKNESDKSFLRRELDKIEIKGNKAIIYDYFTKAPCTKKIYDTTKMIYPFGCNKSQLEAIRNALTHNISVIEGPPGTGKTQTILNIIANVLKDNKSIAIVSGNNSATSNVAEKLAEKGYKDIVAVLGNNSNQEEYFSKQRKSIDLFEDVKSKILNCEETELARNTPKLETLLELDNKLDILKRDIFQLEFEAETFQESHTLVYAKDVEQLLGKKRWSSEKWMSLRDCCQAWNEQDKYVDNGRFRACLSDLKIWFKVLFQYHFRINSPKIVSMINDISDYAALKFYEAKNKELSCKKKRIANELSGLDTFRKQQQKLSEHILRNSLNENIKREPLDLNKDNYKGSGKFAEFIKQVPIILSTTNSIRKSIASDFLFDYLVIDEASQVDLITASIALSCTKNVIVVGDEKQLPHIVSNPREIRELRREKDMFNYVDHSILTSIKQLPNVPSVTLLEHYRCNPLIIDFCNQRFYDGKLIIKTEWSNTNPFEIYTTDRKKPSCVLRDESRGISNPEQHLKSIEVVKAVLNGDNITSEDVCVIAPYRAHVDKSKPDLEGVAVDTVHKFQGREKKIVIIATVEDANPDDKFMNNPNLVNVAVSRAVSELKLICGYNVYKNTSVEHNMGALIRYMMCYGGNITFHSIFDHLHDCNLSKSRTAHLETLYGSSFASENLIHEQLKEKILKDNNDIGILCNYPLRYLIESIDAFTGEEKLFISRSSHVDFFLFNKIDKSPVLAIEVNGQQHKRKKQANRDRIKKSILEKCNIKLLSLDTLGGNEVEQIKNCLFL